MLADNLDGPKCITVQKSNKSTCYNQQLFPSGVCQLLKIQICHLHFPIFTCSSLLLFLTPNSHSSSQTPTPLLENAAPVYIQISVSLCCTGCMYPAMKALRGVFVRPDLFPHRCCNAEQVATSSANRRIGGQYWRATPSGYLRGPFKQLSLASVGRANTVHNPISDTNT